MLFPLLTTRTKIQPPQETQAPCGWANPNQGPVQRNGLSGKISSSGGMVRPEELTCSEKCPIQRNYLLKVQSYLLSIQRKISLCSGFIIFFKHGPKYLKACVLRNFTVYTFAVDIKEVQRDGCSERGCNRLQQQEAQFPPRQKQRPRFSVASDRSLSKRPWTKPG